MVVKPAKVAKPQPFEHDVTLEGTREAVHRGSVIAGRQASPAISSPTERRRSCGHHLNGYMSASAAPVVCWRCAFDFIEDGTTCQRVRKAIFFAREDNMSICRV